MPMLTITTKGQVALRKDLLQHLGVHPGEKVSIEMLPDSKSKSRQRRRKGKCRTFSIS
jgi:hypothetical protein